MDYLDILNGTGYQTYKGEFYAELTAPIGIDQAVPYDFENPVPFFYEPTETTRSFGQPVQNIRDTKNEEYAIRTKSTVFYGKELGGFVKLQDGNFYEVLSCTVDRRGTSRQAAVYVPVPVGADYIVRLLKIDNPFKTYGISESANISFDLP